MFILLGHLCILIVIINTCDMLFNISLMNFIFLILADTISYILIILLFSCINILEIFIIVCYLLHVFSLLKHIHLLLMILVLSLIHLRTIKWTKMWGPLPDSLALLLVLLHWRWMICIFIIHLRSLEIRVHTIWLFLSIENTRHTIGVHLWSIIVKLLIGINEVILIHLLPELILIVHFPTLFEI